MFAVRAPSSYIVLFNLAKEVKGEETKITSLAERADYSNLAKIASDEKSIAAGLVGARYAVAHRGGVRALGRVRSVDELAAAQAKLDAAEAAQASKKSSERKQAPLLAREATQAGEEGSARRHGRQSGCGRAGAPGSGRRRGGRGAARTLRADGRGGGAQRLA